ncbi:MAG: hypothetical protein EXS00_02910, partial [Phycisphaerales bacterium]|nr:hypothetical protein [Phycisphaerales bacterium]
MNTSQRQRMDAAVTQAREMLEAHGLFVISHSELDQDSWGRTDLCVSNESSEGACGSGKVQIHLNKKGVISLVPQGALAHSIGKALGVVAGTGKPGVVSQSRSNKSPAQVGDIVVDCSKFGDSVIGPTEWQAMRLTNQGWVRCRHSELYPRGHNNLGEFLAIIGALQSV